MSRLTTALLPVAGLSLAAGLTACGGSSASGSEHPLAATVTSCATDPALHLPAAKVDVHNKGGSAATVNLTVEFKDASGKVVTKGYNFMQSAPAKSTAHLLVLATTPAKGQLTCTVTELANVS